MKIGYARVSTEEQNLDLQIDALTQAGCVRIFQDHGVSGALESRPALTQAIGALERGDTLVTWKLDRLGRNLFHLIGLVGGLERRGVNFKSLSEALDTGTTTGRLHFHVMGAIAEFERALISERTRAGIASARARGKVVGRPTKLAISDVEAASKEFFGHIRSLRDLAEAFAVSTSTLRRALRKSRLQVD